ncbi:MAG TPA: hypothetical protein VJZ27_11465, partial [Aggregatilineales bacterium]|nr:hypothetical protein [Aggregatilineales bacterium]
TDTPTDVPVESAAPLAPPIVENLDDGAANWVTSGNWLLTPEADVDAAGSGWQAAVGVEPALLTFRPALDLRSVPNPLLSFQSRLTAAYSSASVEVSLDGVNWQPVAMLSPSADWQTVQVDLNAYRGQMIALRFTWLSRLPQPDDPGVDSWQLDSITIEDAPPPTAVSTEETPEPTATEVPTEPTEAPTAEPTEAAPADSVPAESVPLDAEAPAR